MEPNSSSRPASKHVFHRQPRKNMPQAIAGDGPYVIGADGKRYFDASGGAAVSCLGHSHAKVIEKISEQLNRLPFVHTSFFTAEPIEELAEFLCHAAPGNLTRAYFTSGGSESVETALKLARQFFVEKGEPARTKIVARRQSYHGNTIGALSAGGNLWRRKLYEPILIESHHVSPCYSYRDMLPDETDETYGARLAKELEDTFLRLGPETVMCFVAETVSGATLGCVPPVADYFKKIRNVCDKYGVLLILDEVMCGMGRTGSLFAYEQEGIVPDIVTLAKGLGAGYQSIGAVLTNERIFSTIVNGTGFFQHGHTYTGHVTACAGALAVQRVIKEENLLANVRAKSFDLFNALEERFGNHHHIGNIRGRGLFVGLEIVQDRSSKETFHPKSQIANRLKSIALENGLMCYPMSGVIDGIRGDQVMLAPPFNIENHHIDEIVTKLGKSIDETIRSTPTSFS